MLICCRWVVFEFCWLWIIFNFRINLLYRGYSVFIGRLFCCRIGKFNVICCIECIMYFYIGIYINVKFFSFVSVFEWECFEWEFNFFCIWYGICRLLWCCWVYFLNDYRGGCVLVFICMEYYYIRLYWKFIIGFL